MHLQRLEQRHEIPNRKHMLLHESIQVLQRPQLTIKPVLEQRPAIVSNGRRQAFLKITYLRYF
jgi:hypothetical protein